MDTFTKQPNETYRIQICFNNIFIETSETIASSTVVATLNDVVVTSTIIKATTNTTTSVYIDIKSGTTGNNYKITTKITTNLSNIYEKDIVMKVSEI